MKECTDYVFGSMLRVTRKRMGLSQSELTELTGVPNIGHYETGMRLPNYETLLTFCVKMKVSPSLLMFGAAAWERDLQNRASIEPITQALLTTCRQLAIAQEALIEVTDEASPDSDVYGIADIALYSIKKAGERIDTPKQQ